MARNPGRLPAVLVAALLVAACQANDSARSGGGDAVRAQLVWQGLQCGQGKPGARWIADQGAFQAVVESASRGQLGGSEPEVPAIDFERHGAILVALGQKPTAGYSIALQSTRLEVGSDDLALLRVRFDRPAEDSAQAQVMTSPCAVISVERGGYAGVEIVAQSGEVFARLDSN